MNINYDITEQEEHKIWLNYKKHNHLKDKNYLIQKYIPLVRYVVGKISHSVPYNFEFEDLIGFGTFGLMDAISKFDPTKGTKFKTYGITRIRGQIFDEIRSLDWVPRSVRQKHKMMEEMKVDYKKKNGHNITNEQLSELMGISLSEVERISNMSNDSNIGSLNDVWMTRKNDEEVSVIDTLKSNTTLDPSSELEKKQIKIIIAKEIKKLPEKEQKVLVLYYYEELTLKEIGEVLSVTESRVSQLHGKAVRSIRSSIEELKKAFI